MLRDSFNIAVNASTIGLAMRIKKRDISRPKGEVRDAAQMGRI
jgi:hypothetical protein